MVKELKISLDLFNRDNIMNVLAKMAAKISIQEIIIENDIFIIKFLILEKQDESDVKAEINMRLVEQKIKDEVYTKTKDIRTLILANAFSKTSLIDY